MAYSAFNQLVPSGSQTGPAFALSANTNDKALRDGILMGLVPGFVYSYAGPSDKPTVQYWTNATVVLRATNTWTGDYLTTVVWALSTTGLNGTYDQICNDTRSFDADGNLTGHNNGSFLGGWLASVAGKIRALGTSITSHASLVGSAVHQLGTISTQNASGVAISGGSINNTSIGTNLPAEGYFTRATEQHTDYAVSPAIVDWAKGGSRLTADINYTISSFANVASSRLATHTMYCYNFNKVTFPAAVNWGSGGKPSINGTVIVQMLAYNYETTNTIYGIVAWRAV